MDHVVDLSSATSFERTEGGGKRARRAALLSVHTCPLDQPGTGDSGGMNVYVRQVARKLGQMGIEVDVFTRWAGTAERVREVDPGVRVIHLEAGPPSPIPKSELHDHLCAFLYSLMQFGEQELERVGEPGPYYDVIHAHYWLSGWVGRLAAERWGIPLAQSFHTLGRVKNLHRAPQESAEPAARIQAEEKIVASADRVLASTATEAAELVRLYDADPARVSVITPGVDTDRFKPGTPRQRVRAREALGLDGGPLVLFVGRLQPLKAPDIAVRAIAHLAAQAADLDARLLIVGGPSGDVGTTPDALRALAASLGVADRVIIHDPVPHESLLQIYRAADVVLVPSRSESFGLVALEASACGIPVVAADVGGLRTAVRAGETGLLVPGHDPGPFADALERILRDPAAAGALGATGAGYARRFDWRRAAAGLLGVYDELVTSVAAH